MACMAIGVATVASLTLVFLRHREALGAEIASDESKNLTAALWRVLEALLTGSLFFLTGHALPEALSGAKALPWPRYDKLAVNYASAVALAAIIAFWT